MWSPQGHRCRPGATGPQQLVPMEPPMKQSGAKIASNCVDLGAPGANMYGCQPCPQCGAPYRFQLARNPENIYCDDCGLVESAATGGTYTEE